jgi:hypothetical protein
MMNIFGFKHIFLSSNDVANELLTKRHMKHSDRPRIYGLEDSKDAPEYLPLMGVNGKSVAVIKFGSLD